MVSDLVLFCLCVGGRGFVFIFLLFSNELSIKPVLCLKHYINNVFHFLHSFSLSIFIFCFSLSPSLSLPVSVLPFCPVSQSRGPSCILPAVMIATGISPTKLTGRPLADEGRCFTFSSRLTWKWNVGPTGAIRMGPTLVCRESDDVPLSNIFAQKRK